MGMKDFDLIVSSETLERNAEQKRNETIKVNKKIKRQEKISIALITTIILLILAILLMLNAKLTNNYVKGCIEKGYSYNYCVEHS